MSDESKIDIIESVHRRKRAHHVNKRTWLAACTSPNVQTRLEIIIEFRSNDLTKFDFVVSDASRRSIFYLENQFRPRGFAWSTSNCFRIKVGNGK